MPKDELQVIVDGQKDEKLAIDKHFEKTSAQKAHDISVVIESLSSKYGLNQKAVLTQPKIFALLRAMAYNEKYPSELGAKVIDLYLELSISDKGRWRDDVVKIVNTVLATQAPHGNNNLFDRLFGGIMKR